MVKALIVLATCIASIPAAVQATGPVPTVLSPNYDTVRSSVEMYQGQGPAATPTMRRLKLERARALHAEAAALLKQDGGKLTPEHESYVRGEACKILGIPSVNTGSLVRRECGV